MPIDLKRIARLEREAFQSVNEEQPARPRYTRYYNDDRSVWIDILCCAATSDQFASRWGTIGLSRFDTDSLSSDGRPIRCELVGLMDKNVETFGNMLTSCALNVATGGYGLEPDIIYPDIVRQYEPDSPMEHMLIGPVSMTDKLTTIQEVDDDDGQVHVTFLQVVPITDAEMQYARKNGVEALKDRLEEADADISSLQRASVA